MSHRDPEVARRDDRDDRGDAERQRDPAVEDVRPAGGVDRPVPRPSTRKLAALQIRQAMVGRWFFMIIGTIFSITPAFVYWLAGHAGGQRRPRRPDGRRRSSRSRRSRAGCSSRSASCSTSRSRSRARWPCSTGSSSTSRWIPRSSTRPTRSRSTRRRSVARSAFRDVSFRYPTAAGAAAGRRSTRPATARDAAEAVEAERRQVTPSAAMEAVEARARAARRWRAADRARPAVRARGHRLRGASRASWSRWSGRRARARPRRPT